jgi:hypothetical protein
LHIAAPRHRAINYWTKPLDTDKFLSGVSQLLCEHGQT